VMPCNVGVGYQRFRGPCCLHLQGKLSMMMIQVKVFWVVTLCSVVVAYQRFGGPCCNHL
jgi:hypothetical protein